MKSGAAMAQTGTRSRRAQLQHNTTVFHTGDSSSIDVIVTLRLASHALYQIIDTYCRAHDLTASRSEILMALHGAEEHTLPASKLAEALFVTRGNITFLLKSLIDEGLVSAKTDARDARYTLVSLTPRGLRSLQDYAPNHYRALDIATGGLSAAEKQQLLKLLDKLREHAEVTQEEAVTAGSVGSTAGRKRRKTAAPK
jgi:MarR family 2-MHQ and catechol resistance regulon transcriptional repressor